MSAASVHKSSRKLWPRRRDLDFKSRVVDSAEIFHISSELNVIWLKIAMERWHFLLPPFPAIVISFHPIAAGILFLLQFRFSDLVPDCEALLPTPAASFSNGRRYLCTPLSMVR
jgi:hypothetical protein